MLGKVFEELVTGRREKGGYYTPKEIVTCMCLEAIKGYLGGYAELVDEHDFSGISVSKARELLKKLPAIKVVDPACGSGAYLLGMLLQESRDGSWTRRNFPTPEFTTGFMHALSCPFERFHGITSRLIGHQGF